MKPHYNITQRAHPDSPVPQTLTIDLALRRWSPHKSTPPGPLWYSKGIFAAPLSTWRTPLKIS